MKESDIVYYIKKYLKNIQVAPDLKRIAGQSNEEFENARLKHRIDSAKQNIELFFTQKEIAHENDKKELMEILLPQCIARDMCIQNLEAWKKHDPWSSRSDYGGGYSRRYSGTFFHGNDFLTGYVIGSTFSYSSGSSRSGSRDGKGLFALFVAAVIAVALVAAYGMATDLFESIKELSNAQRVNANLGTLALTGTYVFGATLAAIAIFASNPVGWGLAAAGALVIGVALLVKATRALLNTIEAIKEQESGLTTDSRFKLTKNEVANLKKLGYSSKDISAIKDVIRGLAVRASTMSETAFIGSNDDYSNLIEELTKIKQGTISEDIKEIYCIKGPGKSAPSIDETQAGEEASPVI